MVSFIFSPKDCKLAGNLTSWVAAPVKETLMPTSNGVIEIPTPSLRSLSLFLKMIEGWAEIGIFQTTSTKPPWSTRSKQWPFAAHRAGQCNNTLHAERGGVLPPEDQQIWRGKEARKNAYYLPRTSKFASAEVLHPKAQDCLRAKPQRNLEDRGMRNLCRGKFRCSREVVGIFSNVISVSS